MESRIDIEESGERESKAPDNQSRKNAPFVESRSVGMLLFHVGDQHATSIPSALFAGNEIIGKVAIRRLLRSPYLRDDLRGE